LPENEAFCLDDDLALLSKAAKEAGRIALGFFNNKPKVWMKAGDKSPVSAADFAVDAYLKQVLLEARPDYGWISEESTDERLEHFPKSGNRFLDKKCGGNKELEQFPKTAPARSYQRCFIVDPIDGTRGFINGSSQWCISLAIIEAGRPICGVLECPVVGEHYQAHREQAAMMNDVVLPSCNPPGSQGDNPVDNNMKIRISGSRPLTHDWPQILTERLEFSVSIPSLAYRLALVARSGLDVVIVRPNSHDWDLAAADIILEKTGHRLVTLQAKPVHYGQSPFCHGLLLASNVLYQEQILPHLDNTSLPLLDFPKI